MPKKKTHEEFIEQMSQAHPDITILSQYINNKTHVICNCIKCNTTWKARPDNLLHGYGCPTCGVESARIKRTKSVNEFIKQATLKFDSFYLYDKVNYLNSNSKVIITCPIHGDFQQTPDNHLAGHGCPKCGALRVIQKKTKTIKDFVEDARKIHGDKYDYNKAQYVGVFQPITIVCPKHGEFNQIPNAHLNGNGCPKCKQSHGEYKIEQILKTKHIKFIKQFKIDIDKNINKSGNAFIDFYLPDYYIFIEYNGEQHYRPVLRFGGEIKFQQQKKRDQYVRDFCKDNNIKLLEISYKDNINEILVNL